MRSCRGTTTPSMFPNMDDRPRQNSMIKKSTDQSGAAGILVMASVNTMNASPVPSTPCRVRQARHPGARLALSSDGPPPAKPAPRRYG